MEALTHDRARGRSCAGVTDHLPPGEADGIIRGCVLGTDRAHRIYSVAARRVFVEAADGTVAYYSDKIQLDVLLAVLDHTHEGALLEQFEQHYDVIVQQMAWTASRTASARAKVGGVAHQPRSHGYVPHKYDTIETALPETTALGLWKIRGLAYDVPPLPAGTTWEASTTLADVTLDAANASASIPDGTKKPTLATNSSGSIPSGHASSVAGDAASAGAAAELQTGSVVLVNATRDREIDTRTSLSVHRETGRNDEAIKTMDTLHGANGSMATIGTVSRCYAAGCASGGLPEGTSCYSAVCPMKGKQLRAAVAMATEMVDGIEMQHVSSGPHDVVREVQRLCTPLSSQSSTVQRYHDVVVRNHSTSETAWPPASSLPTTTAATVATSATDAHVCEQSTSVQPVTTVARNTLATMVACQGEINSAEDQSSASDASGTAGEAVTTDEAVHSDSKAPLTCSQLQTVRGHGLLLQDVMEAVSPEVMMRTHTFTLYDSVGRFLLFVYVDVINRYCFWVRLKPFILLKYLRFFYWLQLP